ncbi:MAG: protein kinase, partial [Myxococcales bacterium]|nr:protein kinase [Myxococcales bacterium]
MSAEPNIEPELEQADASSAYLPTESLGLGSSARGRTATSQTASVVGQDAKRIGRYIVLSTLGAGAMGTVLEAYDPELDRKIALKLLKYRGHDPRAAQLRLQREAQALAKLNHPYVVAVYDVGPHDDQLFVAMEFVRGQTLRQWNDDREAPRPWSEVLAVFIEAGRGLAAAHEAGL